MDGKKEDGSEESNDLTEKPEIHPGLLYEKFREFYSSPCSMKDFEEENEGERPTD